jgi:hypothetical protein
MQELVGCLQKLVKHVINKDYFKRKPSESKTMTPSKSKTFKVNRDKVRLIILSACKSEMIGVLLQ